MILYDKGNYPYFINFKSEDMNVGLCKLDEVERFPGIQTVLEDASFERRCSK
jgi:hypothetical protein